MAVCIVCRSRKVKCDGTLPHCQNCERLGLQCPGYPHRNVITAQEATLSAEAVYKASGIEKRRVGACEACRLAKNRCTKTRPACRRCLTKSIGCVYARSSYDTPVNVSREQSDGRSGEMEETHYTTDHPAAQHISMLNDLTLKSRFLLLYFTRIHPLRCLGFIHKPSFMQALDHGTLLEVYASPLVDIMCALGARLLYLDSVQGDVDSLATHAQHLADQARANILAQLHRPTLQQLMAIILLCEYATRTDQYAMVFLLGGYLFRHMRLLGLDKPSETADEMVDPNREIEIRVVWSCYTIDVLTASGVDKNSAWRGDSPDVPLPCSDAEFLSRIPSKASFLIDALEKPNVIQSLELPALTAILIHLRSAVLRCIREPVSTQNIWDPISTFMSILQKLEVFYANLPPRYLLTELNMYMHKDQHTLGALVSLHLFYHAAMCDLTRISLPGFNFPLAAGFRHATDAFTVQCRERCLFHAREISSIVQMSKGHGRPAFDDGFAADATSESTKIHIVCAALDLGGIESMPAATRVICNNFDALRMLAFGNSSPSPHIRALLSLCVGFGFHGLAKQCSDVDSSEVGFEAEVTGSAGEHHLINTALFRRARSEARAQQNLSSPRTVRSIEGNQDQSCARPPPISPTATTQARPEPEELQQRSMQQYSVADLSMPLSHHFDDSLNETAQLSADDYLRTAHEMAHFLTWDSSDWWNYNAQAQ